MVSSTLKSTGNSRGRGRPRKDTVAQHFTMSVELASQIEAFANADKISRPEAIRRLIEAGLKALSEE